MQNMSSLSIDYCIKLESLSLQRHNTAQELHGFIKRDKGQNSMLEESHNFLIKGMAKPRIMFIHGVDEKTPDIESLAEKPALPEEEDGKPVMASVLFTLNSIAKENEFVPGSRDLYVGCVRTMAVSQKKNGEFQFENVQLITAKGFNIEPQKGMVEAGVLKPVTVTFSPPPGHDPNTPVETSVILTLKGDVTEQIRVMLRAFVVSE